jgi:hypothetical protein
MPDIKLNDENKLTKMYHTLFHFHLCDLLQVNFTTYVQITRENHTIKTKFKRPFYKIKTEFAV